MKTENKEFFKINLLLKDILIKYISLRDIKIGKSTTISLKATNIKNKKIKKNQTVNTKPFDIL